MQRREVIFRKILSVIDNQQHAAHTRPFQSVHTRGPVMLKKKFTRPETCRLCCCEDIEAEIHETSHSVGFAVAKTSRNKFMKPHTCASWLLQKQEDLYKRLLPRVEYAMATPSSKRSGSSVQQDGGERTLKDKMFLTVEKGAFRGLSKKMHLADCEIRCIKKTVR